METDEKKSLRIIKKNVSRLLKAQWIEKDNEHYLPFDGSEETVFVCSECSEPNYLGRTVYCPFCGSYMGGSK